MSLIELPSTRVERWRWSDLSALPALAARPNRDDVRPAVPWLDCGDASPRLLFVDGHLDPAASRVGPLEVGQVDARADDHPLARHAGNRGWRLRLGAHSAAPGLIQIVHLSTGGPDHLAADVELDVDAQASVVETFIGEGWANRLTRFTLLRGARLMLARRLLGSSGFVSLTDRASVGEGASLVATTLAAGGCDTRLDGDVVLSGATAFAEFGGALLARSQQRHDANLILRHEQPGGQSQQVWRSVADDQAVCSVAARIEVARAAQKTDAEQSLKGLLLSRTATINAKPELEIFADDVKCAHGATVGELNRDALFYLASRGVPAGEARALLTRSFVADAIERIGEEVAREAFLEDAHEWLTRSSGR